MKFKINNGLGMTMLAVSGLLALASCSDKWDDHYEGNSSIDFAGTTLQYIQSQEDLTDFAQVIKASGYDKDLSSSQVLTIFAPENGTFNKDSLLQLIQSGKKQYVIDRFIKNHISRYNFSLNNSEQTLMLLNEKNLHLGTLADGKVGSANAIRKNVSCKNGVLQVIDNAIPYSANLYEQYSILNDSYGLPNDSAVSLFNFIKAYDDDQLDEGKSVEKGFDENGNKVYVDSVMIRRNTILAGLGAYLYREDSNYVAIQPSLEAYRKRVEESLPYFKYNISYNPDKAVRDSMQVLYANYNILKDLVFNMNSNQHDKDSLFATCYSRYDWEHNVFYNPYEEGGILSKYNSVIECSNGKTYVMDEIPFSIYDSFFHKIVVEGESSYYIETGDNAFTDVSATGWSSFSVSDGDSIMGHSFMEIYPTTSSKQVKVAYSLPNTLSGTYDIYLRMLPENPLSYSYTIIDGDTIKNPPLPSQFRVNLFERDSKTGQFPTKATYAFKNPVDNSNYFHNSTTGIDSVYVGRYTFKECFYGSGSEGVLLQLNSYVTSSNKNKYTKELYLDNISLIPVREEALDQASARKRRN